MKEFNIVNIVEAMESSLRHEVDCKKKDMADKWKEVQLAVHNLAADANETFRTRGESARRIDEVLQWKQKYKHESREREKLQEELNRISTEFERFRTDRRRTNESIMARNSVLVKRINSEIAVKEEVIDALLNDNSFYHNMSKSQQSEWLFQKRSPLTNPGTPELHKSTQQASHNGHHHQGHHGGAKLKRSKTVDAKSSLQKPI